MARRSLSQTLASTSFPLSEADLAYLARMEFLIQAIGDRIAETVAPVPTPLLATPATLPTSPSSPPNGPPSAPNPATPPTRVPAPAPRELHHCARTLLRLHELWHMVKFLLHHAAPAPAAAASSRSAAQPSAGLSLSVQNRMLSLLRALAARHPDTFAELTPQRKATPAVPAPPAAPPAP